ncbi:MAG: hypothetical protein S4CHLAM81_04980 [Chlamydiales bacterium]|nr:hypothetical protein [Chlamydiales bacterium]MCH9635286.1 hypothetical protein [Chlamydiales bacterium]MCH9704248.1 hypothetical protein [Chlamydiota bacterium]
MTASCILNTPENCKCSYLFEAEPALDGKKPIKDKCLKFLCGMLVLDIILFVGALTVATLAFKGRIPLGKPVSYGIFGLAGAVALTYIGSSAYGKCK